MLKGLEQEVYDWKQKRKVDIGQLKTDSYVEQGSGYLIRDDAKYPSRLENFRKFYHELIQQSYPLEAEAQCLPFLFEDTGIQFLAMNSAWEIDEYFRKRSSINDSALSAGLDRAEQQIKDAKKKKKWMKTPRYCGLRSGIIRPPATTRS